LQHDDYIKLDNVCKIIKESTISITITITINFIYISLDSNYYDYYN